jgi:hypothetical protein
MGGMGGMGRRRCVFLTRLGRNYSGVPQARRAAGDLFCNFSRIGLSNSSIESVGMFCDEGAGMSFACRAGGEQVERRLKMRL